MSLVGITHHYPDGTVVEVAVEVDDSFPQSLHEAEARCLSLYRSVVPDVEVNE